MFISIPKEFFVPVLFSEEFRYNFESDTMEYDTEITINEDENKFRRSRAKLADLDYIENKNYRRETEDILSKEAKNIEDEVIEEHILRYIKGFMRYTQELREEGRLNITEEELINQLNLHVNKFKKLYQNYMSVTSNFRKQLSESDIDGMVDYYIGEIEDIYNRHLKSLNCENLNDKSIENVMNEVINDAKRVLKEHIENLNYKVINKKDKHVECEDLGNKFEYEANMYDSIDNELVKDMKK